jgi:hypothetical protein
VLAHTIEAIAHGVIKRVQCNTCKGTHQFKANSAPVNKMALPKAMSLKSKSKASDFAKLLNGKDLAKVSSYSISRQFCKGDLINHAKFGLGVVVEEKDITKIEVLFESGPKILVHARV